MKSCSLKGNNQRGEGMKTMLTGLLSLCVLLGIPGASLAAQSTDTPLYRVAAVQTPAKAINYRDLKGSVQIDFTGTVLLPHASGSARIANQAGTLKIDARFDNLTSTAQFGSEYLTYVFWAISPDGRARNLGELIVKNGRSRMEADTPLQAVSLLVTAEPYFAVSQPSDVVVLENTIKSNNHEKIELVDASFELLPRGQYTKNMSATDRRPMAMDSKTPFGVYQARNAVRIARAAGAEAYASEGFRDAERLLALSETDQGNKKSREMTARQAVQSAEASRLIAVKLEAEASLAGDKERAAEQISSAKSQAASAEMARSKSDDARISAEKATRRSETERAAALDLAADSVAASAMAQADAEDARAAADLSATRARKAEGDTATMRAQLLQQLNSVLQTRDSARGLIVNMSDALFQTGSSSLQPQVREKLARVAGIVSAQVGLMLEVEGHTDNVGSDGSNQKLSENRAQAARDYLVSQGVSTDAIVFRGFGEQSPIASNDTARGRQSNRRVEIVVSGVAIGIMANNQ
jgi:outer membrane protein OmpA-like peptidoglycan-associated protein